MRTESDSAGRLPEAFTTKISNEVLSMQFGDSSGEVRQLSELIELFLPKLDRRVNAYKSPRTANKENRNSIGLTKDAERGEPRFACILELLWATTLLEDADVLLTEKSYEYLRGCIIAANDGNTLLLALSARALLETLGSQLWLITKYSRLQDILKNEQNLDRAFKKIRGLTDQLTKVAYGTKITNADYFTLPEPLNSAELVRQLPEEIQDDYHTICEFVHPNLGTNLSLRRGRPFLEVEGDESQVVSFISCFRPISRSLHAARDVMEQIDHLVVSSFVTLGRLRNPRCGENLVFSSAPYKHRGDGNSEQSRIKFKNVFSYMEFHVARDLYLESTIPTGSPTRSQIEDWGWCVSTKNSKTFFDCPKDLSVSPELRPARLIDGYVIP